MHALREDERLPPLCPIGLHHSDPREGLRQTAGDLGVDLRTLPEERAQRLERVQQDQSEERRDRAGGAAEDGAETETEESDEYEVCRRAAHGTGDAGVAE